jgi:hypothetical protein
MRLVSKCTLTLNLYLLQNQLSLSKSKSFCYGTVTELIRFRVNKSSKKNQIRPYITALQKKAPRCNAK